MNSTQTRERRVTVIPADPQAASRMDARTRKLRVAAYCRVSTDDEEQRNSYMAQKEYYSQLIANAPDWEFAGVFADEGITGTSVKKRDDYKRMIAACKRGRIDLILTNSVSRFSRNTVDCINTVRMLRGLGVGVSFEKENIDTSRESNEFLLTLFSSFAQSESESISKNVSWGMQKSMRSGKVNFQYNKLLGYRKGDTGEPEVIPAEAEIVRMIYTDYAAGSSIPQIKEKLEGKCISTKSGSTWTRERIHSILTNEKYMGDALLQKTYTENCLTKKVKRNNGERPQYYIADHHAAIVERELWRRVQEEMARRSAKRKVTQKAAKTENGKYSGKYALSERLICGECGAHYRRCTWVRNGQKRIVWRCISRLEYGTQYCKDSPTLDEDKLHEAILKAINRMLGDRNVIEDNLKQSLAAVMLGERSGLDMIAVRQRLSELNAQQAKLISEAAGRGEMDEAFLESCKAVNDEILQLKESLRSAEQASVQQSETSGRYEAALSAMRELPAGLQEYDDRLVARVVRQVTVSVDGGIKVEFINAAKAAAGTDK